ncbi:MAG: ATP-binding protein [Candidatus Aminicenantes bacterium]|nr:ATP-binding protein [Candidatus Aminicenantes bacterium]
MQLSTKHIDYLQRSYMPEDQADALSKSGWAAPVENTLCLVRISGRIIYENPANMDEDLLPEMADVLTGLHEMSAGHIFIALGSGDKAEFFAGSCGYRLNESGSISSVGTNPESLINGICPGLQTAFLSQEYVSGIMKNLGKMDHGAIALGSPSMKHFSDQMLGSQMDRILRSLMGCVWGYLTVGVPVHQQDIISMANRTLNEIRMISDSMLAAGGPSPVGNQYIKTLEALHRKFEHGKSSGLWHCGVFLLSEKVDTLKRLKAAVRAAMSGENTGPDPFTVLDAGDISKRTQMPALPFAPPPEPPGQISYPYRFLSLLNSSEVAALSQLPRIETPGFNLFQGARFDVNPHGKAATGINLGSVIEDGKPLGPSMMLETDIFKRHTMVGGTTGSGKTNTIFHLLSGFAERGIPFLVIEPAKSEYRCLDGALKSDSPLQVFTPGRENCAPLRLNPFEVQQGISVSEHIDLLRAAFSASFGLWTPLPQVLEQSLYAVYRDRGWDLVRNSNSRLAEGKILHAAFPTLSDLVDKVRTITANLGYSKETTDEIGSALITRLNALRIGGKGRMLDTERSLPSEVLFSRPTVIELEGLGADEDKAFVIALLLLRLAAFRRRQGPSHSLKHILIIEEAHRLLANVSMHREEREADPKGKAVETFVNLLAEVRAYGQGVVVADQVPVKLAPDLIKNTNLKIAHRIVDETDRIVVGGSMIMSDGQERFLATLKVGEAAVFGSGDDNAILVQVPLVESIDTAKKPSDEAVGKRMEKILGDIGPWAVRHAPCGTGCSGNPEACSKAAGIFEDEFIRHAFSRLVLSMISDREALNRLWPDILQLTRRHAGIPEKDLLKCLSTQAGRWLIRRRGSQAGWPFQDTQRFEDCILSVLLGWIDRDKDKTEKVFKELEKVILQLCARKVDPYPACDRICSDKPAVCLYRRAAADIVEMGGFSDPWKAAEKRDRAEGKGYKHLWNTCMDAAYRMIEFPEQDWPEERKQKTAKAARQAALCFGQQMLTEDPEKIPRTVRILVGHLIREARHG